MAHVLDFDKTLGLRVRTNERRISEERHSRSAVESNPDDFWPEVACGRRVKQPVDPANTPQRVLGEMALILGGCGLLIALISLFVHGPPLS